MTAPRWYLIIVSLAIVNIAVVAVGSMRRVWAQTPTVGENVLDESTTKTAKSPNELVDKGATPPQMNNDVGLAIPTELPQVPSLGHAAELTDDPVFQEIQKMLSAESQPKSSATVGESNAEYLELLQSRLATVTKICQSARSITMESARKARAGDTESSRELLSMALQLRELATNLLAQEL